MLSMLLQAQANVNRDFGDHILFTGRLAPLSESGVYKAKSMF